jgi:predicted enzyme related to lactoylglutathione lyase
MVTRDTAWPAGTPCWVDLGVDDMAKARAFYGGLFGWTAEEGPPEAGGYSMCEMAGQQVAGIGPKMGPAEMPSVWTTYLATEDADETAAKIKAAGGQLMMEPFDVMDAGRMGIAVDPGGAVFGIWQSGQTTGVRLANEPGSLVWNENMSRDFEGNKAFYHAVFGFEFGDMSSGDFTYATLDLDGRPAGGIGGLGADVPAEHPAHWSTYFGVDDTDAAVAKVTELGGRIIQPATDSPYGRVAVVADNQGAVFSVMSIRPAGDG